MKIAAIVLLALSGGVTSYILVKESSHKVEMAEKIFDFVSYMEERIVYLREPLRSIISSYEGGAELFEKIEKGGGEMSKLADGICCSTFEIASADVTLLKKCAEKEMIMMKKEHTEMKKAKIVLPLAASLLAAIFII
ncbi:MAG: hypothetical protein IJS45_01595 [Clostridia bacterium]|nr:hypothetical protein [Clostridia bacterium]